MNTKKVFFGILACVTLFLTSCTSNSASEDDGLYEQSPTKKTDFNP